MFCFHRVHFLLVGISNWGYTKNFTLKHIFLQYLGIRMVQEYATKPSGICTHISLRFGMVKIIETRSFSKAK